MLHSSQDLRFNNRVRVRESEYYGPTTEGVSLEAHWFISDWQDSPNSTPTDGVIIELKKFVPYKPVVLWRGGSKFVYDLQSWSFSKSVA